MTAGGCADTLILSVFDVTGCKWLYMCFTAPRHCTTCCWCQRWRRRRSLKSVWNTGITWQQNFTGRALSPPPAPHCCLTCHLADTCTCLCSPRSGHTHTHKHTPAFVLLFYGAKSIRTQDVQSSATESESSYFHVCPLFSGASPDGQPYG